MADEQNTGKASTSFGRRLGEIAWGGFKESVGSQFSALSDIKADADTIKSQVIQDGKSALDVFNRFKNGTKSPLKKARDWFYSNDMMMGGFGFDNDSDDFDAGFKLDSAGQPQEPDAPRSLDVESMNDIAKKQSGEAYKIAAKQADLHMANTAEIVSSINSRSAELTASVNKLNETLLGISKKLDNMTGVMVEKAKEEEKFRITNYDGSLSLAGVVTGAWNAKKEDVSGITDMAKMVLGQLTPQSLVRSGFDKIFEHEFDALGKKSIANYAEKLNTAIEDTMQTGLTKLIKSDFFTNVLGINLGSHKREDYQRYATNQYTTKPATFDGMTRMSIISVIPEYLKSIEAAITGGPAKTVDERGRLTTKSVNHFQNAIGGAVLSGSSDAIKDMTSLSRNINSGVSGKKFSNSEIRLVLDAIKMGFLVQMEVYNSKHASVRSNGIVDPDELVWGSDSPRLATAINYAIEMLTSSEISNGRNTNDISNAINWIMASMSSKERRAFAQEITAAGEKITKTGMNFAQTSPFAHQASKVTQNMLTGILHNKITNRLNPSQNDETTNATPTDNSSKTGKPGGPLGPGGLDTGIGEMIKSGFENIMIDHEALDRSIEVSTSRLNEPLFAIANILRKGLNVFVTGQDNSQDSPYTYRMYSSMQRYSQSGDFGKRRNRAAKKMIQNGMFRNWINSKSFGDSSTDSSVGSNDKTGGNKNGARTLITVRSAEQIDLGTASDEEILEVAEEIKEAQKDNPNATLNDPDKIKEVLDAAEKIEKKKNVKNNPTAAVKNTADKLKNNAGVVKEGAKEVFEILKDTPVGKLIGKHVGEDSKLYSIIHSDEAKNVKESGSKLIDSLFENVGNKVDNASKSASAKIESLGDKVFRRTPKKEQKFTGSDEEKEVLDMYNEWGTNKMASKLSQRMNIVNKSIGKDLNSTDDNVKREAEEDQQTMQQLQMYMNSAGVDGSFSKKDIADVRVLINQIHNKKAKANMARYFIPMMMKNSPGSAMENVEPAADGKVSKKNKSLIGSMLGGMAKYAGLIFKPITKILGTGLKVLLGISGLILKISGKIIKSGLTDIKYGAQSLGGALFGSKKKGEESMGMLKRGITLPSRINKAIGAATGISLTKLTDVMGTFIAKTFTNMVDAVGRLGKNFAKVIGKAGGAIKGFFNKLGESKLGQGVKTFFGNAGEKILDRSDFLKGFTSARRAKREADVERLTNQKAKTKSEAEAEKTNTFLGQIKELVAKIFDTTKEGQAEKEKEKAKAGEEANEPKKSLKERAKDKWNSIKERSASLKEKISQDGGRVSLKDALHGAGFGRAKNTEGQGSFGLDLGKMLGGITNILGGIGKIVLGAIAGLSGFKTMMNMITQILSTSLKPLNKAFQKITKVLRPVMITIRNAIRSIATVASDVASSLIDVIQPILQDTIMPLIEDLAPMLTDLCKVVSTAVLPILNVIMKVILVPLLGYVIKLMPIIEMAAAGIQIMMGVLEGIFGAVLSVVGFLTMNKSTKDQGAEMMSASDTLIKQGISDYASSTKALFKNLLGLDKEETPEAEPEVKKVDNRQPYVEHGSILEGTYGNGDTYNNYYGQVGDINTNTNTSNLKNIYGSATAQGSYGNYLGMNKHGCGPMALADVVARRTGTPVSSLSMASTMSRGGMYNPNRGTSVANYISAAGAMGVGLTPGGVTSRSLSRATPNNPVTLVGSGNGFGTRNGNTHYVNVLGTKNGMAYVSNPYTGHVERRSVGDLVSRSALGLYGSGDGADETYYSFPEAVQDAMNYLKNLAGSLLKMFTGETVEEQVEKKISEQSQSNTVEEAKKLLGDDYQACEDAAREAAYADYAQQHPKLDSESDEDYKKKQEAYFQKNIVKYLARQDVFSKAAAKNGDVWANILNMHDDATASVKHTASEWSNNSKGSSATAEKWITTAEGDVGKDRSEVNCAGDHDWCANYISELFKRTGYTGAYNRTVGYLLKELQDKPDEWQNSTEIPGRGDILFFDWNNPTPFDGSDSIAMQDPQRRYDHIAIIKDVTNDDIVYIDGNGGGSQYVKERSIPRSDDDVDTIMRYIKDRKSSSSIDGKTNRDKVWRYLVTPQTGGGLGFSREGAAGVMANMLHESGFEPNNVEDYWEGYVGNDEEYTSKVNSGNYGAYNFAHDHPERGDDCGVGYGLVQFTWHTLKDGLYNYVMNHSKDISNIADQLDYFKQSMNDEHPSLIPDLESASNYGDAAELFLRTYERPKNMDSEAVERRADAKDMFELYQNMPIPASLTDDLEAKLSPTSAASKDTGVGSGYVTSKGAIINSAGDAAIWSDTKSQLHTGDYVKFRPTYRRSVNGNIQKMKTGDAWLNKKFKITGYSLDHGVDTYDLQSIDGKTKIKNVTRDSLVLAMTRENVAANAPNYLNDSLVSIVMDNSNTNSGYDLIGSKNANKSEASSTANKSSIFTPTLEDIAITSGINANRTGGRIMTPDQLVDKINQADKNVYHGDLQLTPYNISAKITESYNNMVKSQQTDYGNRSQPDRWTLMRENDGDLSLLNGNGDWNIESFVGQGDEIPPINAENSFWTEMGYGDGSKTVNTYNIVRTTDTEADKRVNAILKHTFEIKSATIEAKLQEIIDKMDNRKSWSETYTGSNNSPQPSNTKLFDEYIPSQVTKLSVG